MDINNLTLFSGLLMGLASSLHCASMCGGIASSLMFAVSPSASQRARVQTLLFIQSGRVTAYIMAGIFLGSVGSTFYGAFDHAAAYQILRWAAAVALGWIGFSVIGLVPPLLLFDKILAPVNGRFRRSAAFVEAGGIAAPFVCGFGWGLLPCGMVYGALFYAMLTGSGVGGAMVMAGFGLGTLPSVTAAALGVSTLRRLALIPRARIGVGLAILCVAAASVIIPASKMTALCFH